MRKMHLKTIIREIKHSFGRFIAITAIVALGVGFLIGILSTTPDMKTAVNDYYVKNQMPDLFIKSSMGLTAKDRMALLKNPQVSEILPFYSTDTEMTTEKGIDFIGRICGMPSKDNTFNRLTVTKGRLPKNSSECVIQKPNTYMTTLHLGQTLSITDPDKDTYKTTKFTVVGIVTSPLYFCNEKEPSTAGSGRLGAVIYTEQSAYNLDVYTDFYISLKNTQGYNAFTENYRDYADHVADQIATLSKERIQIRYDDIITKAEKKVKKAQQKLNGEKANAEARFASAQADLDQGYARIRQGEQELDSAKRQVLDGENKLSQADKQLKASKEKLNAARVPVQEAKAALAQGAPIPDSAKTQIRQYKQGVQQYKKGVAALKQQRQQLKNAKNTMAANQQKLNGSKAELQQGQSEYEANKAEAEKKLADGQKKIDRAKKKITEIKKPKWYILDRISNVSYARYDVDVNKVADIATVFPIFFFLVAALVSLTTMTRMVEEERTQIGTLKALGYEKRTIMSKYLIYCGGATALGCIAGVVAGVYLLPSVIYTAYASQYSLPPLTTEWIWTYIISACVLEATCTLGAAFSACHQSLKEKPAYLMLPRAPKAGKRIVLEKIPFIWKRLSFTYKSTARNIFRYKKHLFMTVIGIAGCTALILTGLGLRDSMSEIANKQYENIFGFDMKIDVNQDKKDKTLSAFLKGKQNVKISDETGECLKGDESVSTSVYVPDNAAQFSKLIHLADRKSQKAIRFDDNAVVLTEKTTEILDLNRGDIFSVKVGDDVKELTLTHIAENYVGSYLYVGKRAYAVEKYNGYLVTSGIENTDEQDQMVAQLKDSPFISSAAFNAQTQVSYDNMLSSTSFIVIVLILCAGALAVVVLYNLTNININERSKELATLRVLGYYQNEVARYIFREIGILAILGTAVGLGLGKIFHRYVIVTAENASLMFGRDISPWSYVLAAAITLLFSVLVDFLMVFKIRKIEMVESMKAVD